MATLQEIGILLSKGKQYYSNIVSVWVAGLEIGVDLCHDKIKSLRETILALQYQFDSSLVDKTSDQLYSCLERQIGYTTPELPLTAYFGFLDTKTVLSKSAIESSNSTNYGEGSAYTLHLEVNQTLKYVWFAELLTEPVKTDWQDTLNAFNKGLIGTSDDLFGATQTVDIYRYYITNYKTIFSNPIQLKHI